MFFIIAYLCVKIFYGIMIMYEKVPIPVHFYGSIRFVPALATSLVARYKLWIFAKLKGENCYSWWCFTDEEVINDKLLSSYMLYTTDRDTCEFMMDKFIDLQPELTNQPMQADENR